MIEQFYSEQSNWIGILDRSRAVRPHTRREIRNIAGFFLLFASLTITFYIFNPSPGIDWTIFNRVNWLRPYADPLFANPPWIIFVTPWLLLPLKLGASINRAVMVLIFLYHLKVNKVKPVAFLLLFTSAPFILLFTVNNIDYILLSGILLPAELGLVVVALKPQVAFGGVIVWIYRYMDKITNLIKMVIPITALLLGSFLLWGPWPLEMLSNGTGSGITQSGHNISFWPWTIPLGVWLVVKALKDDDKLLAAVASPLLFPYLNTTSLSFTIAILLIRKDYKSTAWLYGASWYFIVFVANNF